MAVMSRGILLAALVWCLPAMADDFKPAPIAADDENAALLREMDARQKQIDADEAKGAVENRRLAAKSDAIYKKRLKECGANFMQPSIGESEAKLKLCSEAKVIGEFRGGLIYGTATNQKAHVAGGVVTEWSN